MGVKMAERWMSGIAKHCIPLEEQRRRNKPSNTEVEKEIKEAEALEGYSLIKKDQTCHPAGDWLGRKSILECARNCAGLFVHKTRGDQNCRCAQVGCRKANAGSGEWLYKSAIQWEGTWYRPMGKELYTKKDHIIVMTTDGDGVKGVEQSTLTRGHGKVVGTHLTFTWPDSSKWAGTYHGVIREGEIKFDNGDAWRRQAIVG